MKHLIFILMTLSVGLTASAQSKREVVRTCGQRVAQEL